MNAPNFVSLPEEDYLSILNTIVCLYKCETSSDLQSSLCKHVLPLVGADSALYQFYDKEFGNNSIIQWVPKEETLGKSWIEKNAMEISPLKNRESFWPIFKNEEIQFSESHQMSNLLSSIGFDPKAGSHLMAVDPPDENFKIIFRKGIGNLENSWSGRDIRVMELMRPHLSHMVQFVLLKQELARYQSLTEVLAENDKPVAVISWDFKIQFQNKAFENLLGLKLKDWLPKEFLEGFPESYTDPQYKPDLSSTLTPVRFIKLSKILYRISWTLLDDPSENIAPSYLLRLKLAIEPYSKMIYLMQEANLTQREIEVASLIFEGMNDEEISLRLFISVHTVKSHVKSISFKLKTTTRSQLIAFMAKLHS